jgi:hypothetical protein
MRIVLGVSSLSAHLEQEQMVRLDVSVLGTFYEKSILSKLLDLKTKGLWAMLDSGAFSWWARNVHTKSQTKYVMGTSWADSEEFNSYKRTYIDWLKKNSNKIDVYVTLDVIREAEKTWYIWKEMVDEGLHPMPVVHYPESIEWIEKYLSYDVDFIGIGGLVGAGSGVYQWLDAIFRRFVRLQGDQPYPKVHLFAGIRIDFFRRYPFYSADSTKWIKSCAIGFIPVPLVDKKGNFIFDPIFNVKVTRRRSTSASSDKSFWDYLQLVGEETVKRISKEVFNEDLSISDIEMKLQDFVERCRWAIWYYKQLEKYWGEWKDWEVYKTNTRKYLL